jgi:hypothetical protein
MLYIIKLLEKLNMLESRPVAIPLEPGIVLKLRIEAKEELPEIERQLYYIITGSVIYLANGTRLDISYAIGQLARFMADPSSIHLRNAKHLLRYLNGTRTVRITFRAGIGAGLRSWDYKVYIDAI